MCDDWTYKVKVIDIVDTGVTHEGHIAYSYLLENEDGERRWLRECILFDEEGFTEEDWDECEIVENKS